MIKDDLARMMAKKFNLSIAESKRIIDFNFDAIRKELKKNKRAEFRGFGTWHVVKNPSRIYQDKNGKIVTAPAYKRAIFRQSKIFFK